MKKVVLYIAMSLDGFIADKNGEVDWLHGDNIDSQESSYNQFIKTVDTIIMGYNTYNQIIKELSPNKWVYEGKTTYVITHKDLKSTKDIIFTNDNIDALINELKIGEKDSKSKAIWICGGGSIINQIIELDLIDIYHITIIPKILGDGILLFDKNTRSIGLKLLSHKSYNGMVDVIYEKNPNRRYK